MKRIGQLFERICERSNLTAAVWSAARGKRQQPVVQRFLQDLDGQLNVIADELNRGILQCRPGTAFEVRDTKSRMIRAPDFRDRVIQHAIISVAGPVLEKSALHHSYACRRGRGQHAALRQARAWTRRTDWYGKIDFRKYYDSVDHELLRKRLWQRFSEPRLLSLFDRLLEAWQCTPGRGLPIGALSSQYLGNFFLDGFDAVMKASGRCPRYLRYMDDIVIWNDSQQIPVIRELAMQTASSLRLEIKHGGEWNQCRYGVPFVGFVVYPDRVRLGRQGRRRFRRKLRQYRSRLGSGVLTEREFQSCVVSLFAHDLAADDGNWRKAVLDCQPCPDDDLSSRLDGGGHAESPSV
jgi:RNA-directed DNA polymerase